MKRRRKKSQGFFKSVAALPPLQPPQGTAPVEPYYPPTPILREEAQISPPIIEGEVIKCGPAELIPMQPQYPAPRTNRNGSPPQLGPNDCGFISDADGPGYEDKRVFLVQEDGGNWTLEGRWSASGTGQIPQGLKMMASVAPMFNSILNMMVGAQATNRHTQQLGNVKGSSPFSLLFGMGDDDDKSPLFPF